MKNLEIVATILEHADPIALGWVVGFALGGAFLLATGAIALVLAVLP